MAERTYIIRDDPRAISGQSIQCLICGRTSHHPDDVKHRYCGYCHRFHEDVRGPADELPRHVVLQEQSPENYADHTPYRAAMINARLRLAVALGYPAARSEDLLGGIVDLPTEPSEIVTVMTDLALQVHRWKRFYQEACVEIWQLKETERIRKANDKGNRSRQ